MTLIVETGSIVANANSYISVVDFQAYATARGVSIVSSTPEQLLVQAMDYIENLKYKGTKQTINQPLEWPRYNVWIDGYPFQPNTIPSQLTAGQCEVALAIDQGNGPLVDIPIKTVMEKVGPVEVHYSTGSSASVINKKMLYVLQKLLAGGANGGNQFIVNKG